MPKPKLYGTDVVSRMTFSLEKFVADKLKAKPERTRSFFVNSVLRKALENEI